MVLAAGVLFVIAFLFSGWRRRLPALRGGALTAQAAQSLQRPVIAKCVRSATNP